MWGQAIHNDSWRTLKALQWRHNGALASQITSLTIAYSTVYSDADQRKHQSSASLAFVRRIPRTNGQYREKCFHLMTSSWYFHTSPCGSMMLRFPGTCPCLMFLWKLFHICLMFLWKLFQWINSSKYIWLQFVGYGKIYPGTVQLDSSEISEE